MNPFINVKSNLKLADTVKFWLLAVIVFPLKFSTFVTLLLCSNLIGYLLYFLSYITSRNTFDNVTFKLSLTITLYVHDAAFKLLGLRKTIIDLRSDSDQISKLGIITIAPHSSFYDVPLMFSVCRGIPLVTIMQKYNIFLGSLLYFTNSISLHKFNQHTRSKAKQTIIERSNFEQIMIFPEATFGNGTCLLKYLPGAFFTGQPIHPVLIEYRYVGSRNQVNNSSEPEALKQCLINCCSLTTVMAIVTYLPVYHPNASELNNCDTFAENVRTFMATRLDIFASRYTRKDSYCIELAFKWKVSLSPVSLRFVGFVNEHVANCNQPAFRTIVNDIYEKLRSMNGWELSNELDLKSAFGFIAPVGTMEEKYVNRCLNDFTQLLQLNLTPDVVRNIHLLLFATLANQAIGNMWLRVEKFVKICNSYGITTEQSLAYLIWYLVGLEESQLDCTRLNLLQCSQLSTATLKGQLPRMFKTSFSENCKEMCS